MGAKATKVIPDIVKVIETCVREDASYQSTMINLRRTYPRHDAPTDTEEQRRAKDAVAGVLFADLRDKNKFARKFLPALYAVNVDKLEREQLLLCANEACHRILNAPFVETSVTSNVPSFVPVAAATTSGSASSSATSTPLSTSIPAPASPLPIAATPPSTVGTPLLPPSVAVLSVSPSSSMMTSALDSPSPPLSPMANPTTNVAALMARTSIGTAPPSLAAGTTSSPSLSTHPNTLSPGMIQAPGSNGGNRSHHARTPSGGMTINSSPRTTATGGNGDHISNMDGAALRQYALQKMYLLTADQLRTLIRDVEGGRPISYAANPSVSPIPERKIVKDDDSTNRVRETSRFKTELEIGLQRERDRQALIAEAEEKQRRVTDTATIDIVSTNIQGQLWRMGFQSFLEQSEEAARIIVEELSLKDEDKSIQPVAPGSSRYEHQNIVFELADNEALKDCLTLSDFARCLVRQGGATVEVPLTCVVRYHGTALLCISGARVEEVGVSQTTVKASPLQDQFLKWKYEAKEVVQMKAKREWGTDNEVLRYLLQAMQPLDDKTLRSEIDFREVDEKNDAKKCQVIDCDLFPQYRGFCSRHQHLYHRCTAGSRSILRLLDDKSYVRHITQVLASPNLLAHGLAIRTLWISLLATNTRERAAEQFHTHLMFHCCGPKFTIHTKNSLLSVLLNDADKIIEKSDQVEQVQFHQPIVNREAWGPLFSCMENSNVNVRRTALEEINTLLFNTWPSVESLVEAGPTNWQNWVFQLLADLPRERDDAYQSVYCLTMNILVRVHTQFCLKSDRFSELMLSTLHRIHSFAGLTDESRAVITILLTAIATKLSKNKHEFSVTDYGHLEWDNLVSFLDTARRFVFISRHWKTSKRAPAKATSLSAKHQTVDSLERDRKHLRNEASFDRPGMSLNERRMLRGAATTSTKPLRRYADDDPVTDKAVRAAPAPTTGPPAAANTTTGGDTGDTADQPRPSMIDHIALLLAHSQPELSHDHDAWLAPDHLATSNALPAVAKRKIVLHKSVRRRVITALPTAGDELVLRKQRVVEAFPLMGDAPELAEHGFHYSGEGLVADMSLIEAIRVLLKSLRVDTLRSDIHSFEPKPRETLTYLAAEYQFWSDAVTFAAMVNMKTFGTHELLSPRKLAELVARFAARRATPKDRNDVITQMTAVYEKLQKDKTERDRSSHQ